MLADFLIENREDLYWYGYRVTGNYHDSNEILAEASRRILERWGELDASKSLAGWFKTIMRNAWIDECRRYEHRNSVSLDLPPTMDGLLLSDIIADHSEGQEDRIIRHDEAVALAHSLELLNDRQQRFVALCDLQGLTYKQAASALGVHIDTIRSGLSRARVALRHILAVNQTNPGDQTMSLPKGLLGEGYLTLPEGPERTPLKVKYGIAKASVIPKNFPMKDYEKLGFEAKNALREQWHLKPLVGSAEKRTALQNGRGEKNITPFKAAKDSLETRWPRTTKGASDFIKAWNGCKDGNDFMAKYSDGNSAIWGAATHKAVFFRSKGVKLKKLLKTRGDTALYDWDFLKKIAADTAD